MVHIVWLNRNGKQYGYLAHSFRRGSRVFKRKKYYGCFSDERLSLKDLIWLLKGKEGIMWLKPEEQQKWFMMSGLYALPPLCNIHKAEDTPLTEKEVKTIIKNMIRNVQLAPCAACYVIKHGIPSTFKRVFDQYEITDTIMEYANYIAKAYAQPDFVLIEPNEYFQGRPEDYKRAKQFLMEDRETQIKPK